MNVETTRIDIEIREMIPADIDQVYQLERKIFPDPWSKSSFEEQITDSGWGAIVALNSGKIIGYACYFIAVNESHLTNIAVSPDFRRKSVAKQLLENILVIVENYNCEFLLLEVRPSNESAIAFYEKYDFKFLYRRPNYYHNPKEDALVLVKYLNDKSE